MAVLKIKPNGKSTPIMAQGLGIYLDDKPIEEVIGRVTSLELSIEADSYNEAKITFLPESVEIDAEAMIVLEAILIAKKEGD